MVRLGRTRKMIVYHGRKGRPVVHEDATGKKYIMVRSKDGGTKRLYEGSMYIENGKKIRLKL